MIAGMETNHDSTPDTQRADAATTDTAPAGGSTAVSTSGTGRKSWLYVVAGALLGIVLGVVLSAAFFGSVNPHEEMYPGDNNSPQAGADYVSRTGLVTINADDFDAAAQKVCAALEDTDIESLESPDQVWTKPEFEAGSVIDNAESFEVVGLDGVEDQASRDTVTATARRLVMESSAMFACPSQMARMNATFTMN